MQALLDTHTFLWWIADDPQLSAHAHQIISDGANDLFFSPVSGWEIAIKTQLGKLALPANLEEFVFEQLSRNLFTPLPVQFTHVLGVYRLPPLHRDPFDRLLIAQSRLEALPILTVDPLIRQYEVQTIW
jgi:PIN domain nuclease of toxin-antitoxin system